MEELNQSMETQTQILLLQLAEKALAGVAQWTEHRPANQRVAGLIPT